ncbi:hypothetical protein GCM10017786_05270 [Amycolatopsis deserti]|uniref:DUF3048 domain-containing protein n=1 Tax=Amycolatopsis deserti TaxID=185696 RepID=A0ABQ3ICU5_9PSEU|nr:DUF3048 domain-containing protein [Amycolatopsis deserti]GHE78538.1 hypothetical protein GCM10017786_05270 [Amycolatopsis deserti]
MRGRAIRFLAGLASAGLLLGCSTTGSSGPAAPATPTGPVLVVKIDNVAQARLATGLGSADIVFAEPVEGGLSRLAAVFTTRRPPAIGPVRSARETDYDLLAAFGRPVFAYAGAAPEIDRALHTPALSDRIVNASPADTPAAYVRDDARPAPHNLFVRPEALPAGEGPLLDALIARGPAPPGRTPTPGRTVSYAAASFDFRWDGGRWLVWLDGSPLTSTEVGQLGAATVILQQVTTRPGTIADAQGRTAPVAQTVGTGAATLLRDGAAFDAVWSRPTPHAATTFTTPGGAPLPAADGPVWVVLIPTG